MTDQFPQEADSMTEIYLQKAFGHYMFLELISVWVGEWEETRNVQREKLNSHAVTTTAFNNFMGRSQLAWVCRVALTSDKGA